MLCCGTPPLRPTGETTLMQRRMGWFYGSCLGGDFEEPARTVFQNRRETMQSTDPFSNHFQIIAVIIQSSSVQ
jgi:hypothetical protein